jgi:hypothetical protein
MHHSFERKFREGPELLPKTTTVMPELLPKTTTVMPALLRE